MALVLAGVGAAPAQQGAVRQAGPVRGQAALARLGSRLPEVALRYGKTAEELRRLFLSDSSLWLGGSDALIYVDEGLNVRQASSMATATAVLQAAPFPLADTFFLNSRPGSSRTIYLDFDGHTTWGTQWNMDYNRQQGIVSVPFSLDADPYTFSEAELQVIQLTWQRIAEDYAAFDINVTTQYPGEAALTRMDTGDNLYGMRVVISPTNFTPRNIGGIAYFGVFNFALNVGYQPVFVMSDYLCANTTTSAQCAKYLADAGSHEVGHTLGLSHDGLRNPDGTISEYYGGQGDWAPIMGVGFGREVSQWNRGEYAGANNLEDDLAVMQVEGAPPRADDHSNTTRAATYIGSNAVNVSGVISSRTDVDFFTFTVGAGPATINVSPATEGPNLNIRAQLLNSSRVVLATSDSAGLAAGFSTTLAAGTYFLMVDGAGEGDPLLTGYSDYASLGRYTVTGSLPPTGPQAPVAVATASTLSGTVPLTVSFFGSASYDPDGSVARYLWDFGDGTTSTTANPTKTFAIGARYPVTMTVVDNQGLVGTARIQVDALVNAPPVAVVSASSTGGTAPVTVNFSSAGSGDPEGGPLTYFWRFNSTATSTAANPSFTFTEPPSSRVTLTVTDNRGLSSEESFVDIKVTTYLFIQAATTSKSTTTKGTSARVTLTICSADGKPRPFAVVSGAWSGAASASQSASANSKGQVTFTSPTSALSGPFTFTVNNVSYTYEWPYDPTKNVGGGMQSFVIP